MTENKAVTESNVKENEEKDADKQTDLERAIIDQVEYYFGNWHYPRDMFLREQVKLDDGWVPLTILIRFNRLANLSKDFDIIATALKKSTHGLLEISEDNRKVRRNPEKPIPGMKVEHTMEWSNRTIHAKGFPKVSSFDDILNFFKQFEEVEKIVLEKVTWRRLFTGSVSATFKTREQAEKFINNKGLKYNGRELLIHW